ncbi:hypothetical protein B296_00024706, partial [Ensete ventricosum]
MVRGQQQHDGQSASYYAVLGIGRGASLAEVRSAYRKLAMLKKKKSILVRSVLSDEKRRKLYDAGLYDPLQEDEEEVEVITDKPCNNIGVTTNTGRKSTNFEGSSLNSLQGFGDFVQEMVSLMASVRKEGKQYSLEELQQMLLEMAQDLGSPSQPRWSADAG